MYLSTIPGRNVSRRDLSLFLQHLIALRTAFEKHEMCGPQTFENAMDPETKDSSHQNGWTLSKSGPLWFHDVKSDGSFIDCSFTSFFQRILWPAVLDMNVFNGFE